MRHHNIQSFSSSTSNSMKLRRHNMRFIQLPPSSSISFTTMFFHSLLVQIEKFFFHRPMKTQRKGSSEILVSGNNNKMYMFLFKNSWNETTQSITNKKKPEQTIISKNGHKNVNEFRRSTSIWTYFYFLTKIRQKIRFTK